MTPLLFVVTVGAISLLAGFLGSLLGLGGGLIVIPALTLLLHVDIRLAIGASIVSVIATSSGASAAYVREGLANMRVAMFLELGTTLGAITGAFLAGIVHPRLLFVLFLESNPGPGWLNGPFVALGWLLRPAALSMLPAALAGPGQPSRASQLW